MDWIKQFIAPIIEIIFIGGILSFIGYYVFRAFYNAWTKSWKYVLKYRIKKNPYTEKHVKFVMDCIDQKKSYYNTKKELLLRSTSENEVNEIMWIYNQVWKELKGGNR